MSSRKCLLLNYSLVSIFKRGKKGRGKKGCHKINARMDRSIFLSVYHDSLQSRYKSNRYNWITIVSFPRSSHLQPMCKTPYTTWATLIRQWQQHHTTVKQWHTQTNQKKALSRTHIHTHRSNGKGGRWWRTQRNHGTQERLRQKKKENHRFQARDKRVHFTLQGTHASSKQCHGREKQKMRSMNAMPSSYPHAVLPKYSTRPKKEHSREP